MGASTPKGAAKLYQVLKGYKIPFYTGQDLSKVQASCRILTDQELATSQLSLMDSTVTDIRNIITKRVDLFLASFYARMKRIRSAETVVSLADDAKHDYKCLEKLVSLLLDEGLTICSICPSNAKGETKMESQMAFTSEDGKCPRYLKKHFCILQIAEGALDFEDFDDEMLKYMEVHIRCKEYLHLFIAICQLAYELRGYCDLGGYYDYTNSYPLFSVILTYAKIFNLMNPTGKPRIQMVQKVKDLLQRSDMDYHSDSYQLYMQALDLVFKDVREGRLRYIRQMNKTYKICQEYTNKGYSSDMLYFSLKGSGQSRRTGINISLLSSIKEIDYHIEDDRVKQFDLFVGYKSKYLKRDSAQLDEELTVEFCRILGINNPGKFKIRIIHIADNPTQDRCSFIHVSGKDSLKANRNDSSDDHDVGRNKVRRWTFQWSLETTDERQGIFGSDFSNATDMCDQQFTHKVIAFLYNDIIADFWDYCSTMPKSLQNRSTLAIVEEFGKNRSIDESEFIEKYGVPFIEEVIQTSGQPQGLLGSFEIFSLCHHFLFLTAIKLLDIAFEHQGLHRHPCRDAGEETYVVIGDDSVAQTIYPEKWYQDNNLMEPLIDEESGQIVDEITVFQKTYYELCKNLAGLEINATKCTSCHKDDNFAEIDLANVTVRNGQFFSPIPFRLAMNLDGSFDSGFSIATWFLERNMGLEDRAHRVISYWINKLPENKREAYSNLIYGGYIPYLDGLTKYSEEVTYSEFESLVLQFCVLQNYVELSVLGPLLKEHEHIITSQNLWEVARTRFSKQMYHEIWDQLDLVPGHKIEELLLINAEILEALKETQLFTDIDERIIAASLSSRAASRDQLFEVILEYNELKKVLNSLGNYQDFENQQDNIRKLLPDLSYFQRELDRLGNDFLIRGSTKRQRDKTQLFRNVLELWFCYESSEMMTSFRDLREKQAGKPDAP